MKIQFLTLLTTLAFLGFSSSTLMAKPDKCSDWPNCPNPDPDQDVTAKYTAKLVGNFNFLPDAELTGLTANSRGTALTGNFDIEMSQSDRIEIYDEAACPDGPVPCPPEGVFILHYHCPDLVDEGSVTFEVTAGNWEINHIGAKGTPGHVYIAMRNLKNVSTLDPKYSNADFDFFIHGDVNERDLFPPADDPTTIQLTEYQLWAGIGGREKILCNSDGRPELISVVTLTITRDP